MLLIKKLRDNTININSAHLPDHQMWASQFTWALARLQSSKTEEVWWLCYVQNIASTRSPLAHEEEKIMLNAAIWRCMSPDLQWQAQSTELLINLRKVKAENLKFRTALQNLVMDGWSNDRLLKNSFNQNQSSSSQCRSLQGFQTLLLMCDSFECKLWLSPIQNHGRDCFQAFAFAYSHLKLLCCSIEIWEDVLFSEWSLICICCFAQDLIQIILICPFALFLNRDIFNLASICTNEVLKHWATLGALLLTVFCC